jgi:hypothetical protein
MRSARLQLVLDRLVLRFGEGYGRIRFVWLCQRYDVGPLESYVEGWKLERMEREAAK